MGSELGGSFVTADFAPYALVDRVRSTVGFVTAPAIQRPTYEHQEFPADAGWLV